MEKFFDLVDQGFLVIFSLFSLGIKRTTYSLTLSFLLVGMNISIVLYVLVSYLAKGSFFVSYDALSKALDAVDLFFPIFVHISVIFIYNKKQNVFNEISRVSKSIDEHLNSLNQRKLKEIKKSFISAFTLKFFIIHILGIGIDVFVLITLIPGNINWQQAIRSRVISLNVSRLMSTQFIFYCDFISSRMNCFNFELEKTSKKCHSFQEICFSQKLTFLKTLDLKLIKLSLLVREYFKWMLFLNITSDIIIITIDIYWIYGGFIYGDNPFFLQSSLLPISKTVTILLIFSSCSNVQDAKDKSPGSIHLISSITMAVVNSKRRYLLQKLHTVRYQFDGKGFFHINYGTLVSIVEAITIYMVYFFQFMSDIDIFTNAKNWANETRLENNE